MTNEESMGRWFTEATKTQNAAYNQRMADAAPYRGAPKWERMRERAVNLFRLETVEARHLYERAMADLAAWDELSDETSELLTAFERRPALLQAAE